MSPSCTKRASFRRPKSSPGAPTSSRWPSIASSIANPSSRPEKFWSRQAKAELVWFKPWTKVLKWEEPYAKWFVGGQLNVSYNCLDRHLDTARANKAALIWEGEPAAPGKPGEERTLTYKQLHHEVCRFANVLKRNGIKQGDRVLIYLPMVPEAAIAMLACARIGAVHSVVFGGFSAQSVADRIYDSQAKLVITADGGFRRGAVVPLKQNVDEALTLKDAQGELLAKSIEKVIVLRRANNEVQFQEGRDLWWHEELEHVDAHCPAEKMDSEAPLFILYTSGSTGKPKGILHTTGGYLLYAKLTSKYVFDLRDEDVYWCTADVGWVTGHSYVVYGPLANGATSFMYEGAPNFPEPDRFWRIVEKYGVTILYTAPTAIRAFMKWGVEWPQKHDLSSLRLLGTVGEPINPEAWMWYHEVIGGKRCPIVDTWWQTETGGIMITPLPGATPTKPGSATLPFFGIVPEVVDDYGKPVPRNSRRQARHPQAVAGHVARPLGRPAALPAGLLGRSRGQLLHRRRQPAGQGRLFLDRGPHRRRAQRRRPSHRHRGSRERAGQPSEGRRGRGGGPAR